MSPTFHYVVLIYPFLASIMMFDTTVVGLDYQSPLLLSMRMGP
jgi:hypothetical protein